MTRLELVKMRESGKLLVGPEALRAASRMRMFKSPREMLRAIRQHVMLKWMTQQHVTELAEPGENPYGFVGTPEW